MHFVLQVALPVDARLLPKTRQALAGYLEEMVGESDTLHDVILAVDEACANVIRHAFPDGADPGVYEIRTEIDDDEVRVLVEDRGVGVDPDVMGDGRVADPEAMSGRGLAIMRALMSEVDVAPKEEGGTRVVMSKRLG